VRQQDLDRHIAAQPFVPGPPHLARPAGANQPNDGVGPDAFARLQAPPFGRDALRQPFERGLCQKFDRCIVGRQERQRLAPQLLVCPARSSKEFALRVDGKLSRVREDLFETPPPLGAH
jgi:hypothetical protein